MKSYSLVSVTTSTKNDNPAVRDPLPILRSSKPSCWVSSDRHSSRWPLSRSTAKQWVWQNVSSWLLSMDSTRRPSAEEDPNSVIMISWWDRASTVERGRFPYGMAYYNYKERLGNNPKHAGKSPLQKHRMALRFCVNGSWWIFIPRYRTAEGLRWRLNIRREYFWKSIG